MSHFCSLLNVIFQNLHINFSGPVLYHPWLCKLIVYKAEGLQSGLGYAWLLPLFFGQWHQFTGLQNKSLAMLKHATSLTPESLDPVQNELVIPFLVSNPFRAA